MSKRTGVTLRILLITMMIVVVVVGGIVFTMTFFMHSLLDTVMLEILQPAAKTAALSVEGNLHVMAENLMIIRDDSVISSKEASAKEKQAVIDTIISGIEFSWLGLYESDGTLITGCADSPRTLSGRQLLNQIKETNNLVIEDTSIANSGLEIVIGIPVALTDRDGGVRETNYLVGSYMYDVLSDALNNINIGTRGSVYIINSEGVFLAHSHLGKVYSQENVSASFREDEDSRQVFQLMKTRQTGSATVVTSAGQTYISYAPVRGTLWSLGVQAPRDDFITPVRQAILSSIFITIVLLAMALLIFERALKGILSEPLHEITLNAEKLAEGEFGYRLPKELIGRRDEIGQLGRAFRTMSLSVQNVISDIEQLALTARSGGTSARADSSRHRGDYNLIITGINAMLDVFCSHLDAMPGALVLFDKSMTPLYLNHAAHEMLALHDEEAFKGNLMEYLTDWRSESLPDFETIISKDGNGDAFESELAIPGLDGQTFHYTLVLRRITAQTDSRSAETTCYMLILRDVTLLMKAISDAEAASRAKSDFLSNMSHEMRTPMNAIIGMTSIAQNAADVERKDYCLGKIEDASTHLLGVINDVLDMSKIEADKFLLSFDSFNFEHMLQKAADVCNFRAEEKHQDFYVHIDPQIPDILIGDDQRITQVVANLLSNAVKFTPDYGSVRLEAHLIDVAEEMVTIQIEVRDSGIGISQEQQARLFTSFEQAESSTSRRFGGTGLGLAICKRIVEMMDGSIWVVSEPGVGSTFAFTMITKCGEAKPPSPLEIEASRKNLRMLMVDDSRDVRDYFIEIMRQLDVSCKVAESGAEAFEMIERDGSFDVYFVDWRMPGMDGMELTRRIKQRAEPSIVVLVSATEWSSIEAEAKAAGVDRYLPKPLFPSVVAECIGDCIGAVSRETTADETPDDFSAFTVLLAEDVEINREIVQALLEPTALTVDCVENGAAALATFNADPERYDLILMDLQMPEMDGFEATRRIRALPVPSAAQIPIIAMTANVFREDVERCLACGMNAHVGKPLDFDEVLGYLRKYLR